MARVDPQIRVVRGTLGRVAEVMTWGPIASGDEIGWCDLTKLEIGRVDSVQVEGDFKQGQCRIEGSNDGTNGRTLSNSLGMEAIIAFPGGIAGIATATRFIRPVLESSDKATKITVTAYGRGA